MNNLLSYLLLLIFISVGSTPVSSKSNIISNSCLWSLENEPSMVMMCTAEAGTITPDEGFICVPGTFTTINATPDGNMVVPTGYSITYFLTTGANSLIVQNGNTPSFDVFVQGVYTIHPFVYDPTTFDINSIIINITTLQNINVQLEQGGGNICGSLDLVGATTLTEKAIGFVVTSSPETCDAEDGQVILAPPSNSFEWFDGFMGNERNDLADGIYIVTVSQSSGCSGEISVTVNEICQCSTSPTVENIIVFESNCGASTGAATIEMIGNNADYTYEWLPSVSSTNSASNISAGSYNVTITDVNDPSCFSVESFVIGNVDGPDATLVSSSLASCGIANGVATFSSPNFTYNWCNGGTGFARNDLAAGICAVTITDPGTGCFNVVEIIIGEMNDLDVQANIVAQPNCGLSDGIVSISVSGGIGNYTYAWNDGGTGADRFGLSAGIYVITVTDTNSGCSAEEIVTLTNSISGATINISSNVVLSCSGDNNGFVNYTVITDGGFVQPSTEVIRDAAGNTFQNGGLSAGEYCILVYDGNGCLAGENCFEVTQPNPILIDISVVNQTCNQAGSILVSASGGNNNFTYDWADLVGTNDPANRTGLIAGDFSLTATDGNGCVVVVNITVGDDCINPPTCTADAGTLVADANSVCLDNGSALISATPQTNSVIPIGYEVIYVLTESGVIQAVENTPEFTLTNTGNFTIHTLVYDPNTLDLGIVVLGTTSAQEVNGLLIQGGGTICASLDLTGATVSVIDCTPPPTCIADAGTLVADASSACLDNGSALISATPQNNVVVPIGYEAIYVLTESGVIQAVENAPEFTVTNTGTFTIHTLIYDPNTLDLGTVVLGITLASEVNSLLIQGGGTICASLDLAGAIISVTDCNPLNCATPPQLLNIVKIASSCNQSTGNATVNMVGGNSNYTFDFSAGNVFGNAAVDLAVGTYSVTITDINDATCFVVENFTITNGDGPQASIISTSPTSCQSNNGTAQLTPATFDYTWCDGGTGAVRNDLLSGVCGVTVTDPSTGCTNILEVEIIADNLLMVNPIVNNNPDCGMMNGTVVLQVTGGSGFPNYTFQWSDPNSINNAIRTDLPGGTFSVTVTDSGPSGCETITTFTLLENVAETATITIQNIDDVSCPGDMNGNVQFDVSTDAGFALPATDQIVDGAGNIYLNGAIPAGDYCIQVTDGNGCVAGSECFSVGAPDPIIIDVAVFPTTCSQGGTINLTASGGSGSYSYDWADLAGNNDPQNRFDLAVGIYGVTVTDNNSCIAVMDNIIVADGCTNCTADAALLTADSTNICFSGLPVIISASQNGPFGIPVGFQKLFILTMGAGLDILQTDIVGEFEVNTLGTYTIHSMVYDPNTLDPSSYSNALDLNADLLQGGGTICASLNVNGAEITLINCADCELPQIQNIVTIEASCENADGSATVNVVGSSTYNFQWSSGSSTTNSNIGLEAGAYQFTVTDDMNPNCFIVDSLIIGNVDGPDLSVFSQTPSSCNANNGTAVLQPQTNLFDWSDGTSGAIRTDLAPGINIVTVTDPATNCINIYEVFIESIQSLDIQVDVQQQPDCQVNNGSVDIIVTGGSTAYTYVWSDNPSLDVSSRDDLFAGVYTVVVIDNGPNACVDSVSFTLLDNVAGATVTISNLNNEVFVSCAGDEDGEVQYTVALDAGFATPATEMILDANGNTLTNGQLAPGNYCVVVMDANGCLAGESCFEVLDPEQIEINLQVENATCNDPGGITTFAFGGTGFLLFDWSDLISPSDPQNRFNLTPGLYSLTVTDQNGCSAVAENILVQDDCMPDMCPTSSEENISILVNSVDSFCVVLDSCFVDSLTTYSLVSGGTNGNSIFGNWELGDNGCLVYTSNDTAGISVDTICVLANFSNLVDTTCIIVSVIPVCDTTGNIIMEDSITLVTDDCLAGADYCLEIELAQILNFNLTDNGQPFNTGMQGCNFDTTFFYSLAAFLNIAPDGPYSLTSWDFNNNTFTIDSFQTMIQLVDSMNVWDPTGNWVLNGSIITGGAPGTNYETLNLIQISTGATTNLDVDFNQIPNGTLLTLDTGFHELIITDLVTGCSDTLIANVICDDCPDVYSGSSTIVGDDCNDVTDLCLDIPFQEFLFNYEVLDNGTIYGGIRKGCGFDTLSTCYLVSALPDQGMAGPYSVDSWAVGGITFASNFNTLQELLNLMNGWDPTGNWVLDANSETICGGTLGQNYGEMEITQTNTGAIALLEPDYVILTFASAIELDTGFHEIILIDTVLGCTDTLNITIDCDVVTGGIDTLLQVMVSNTDTFCFNLTDTIVSAINLCPDLADGNVSGFGFIPNTNCIEYTGTVVGLDTFCMVFTYSDGTIDTAGIIIQVIPELLSGDTIPLGILINCVETFCIDTSAFLAPIDTIYNYCENSSGNFAEVTIVEPNCVEIMAFNIGGLDTACIVICDTMGVCDTTILLIDVTQPELITVYDTTSINQSGTYCPDTTQLYGVVNSIENICDSLSGTNVAFEVIDSTFCIDFTPLLLGTDTACIVICDDLGTCDTTIYILTVINPIDTIIAVDDDTITYTINPVTIDIFANDIFDPDSLIFGIVTGVSHGTLVSNPDGSFTYLAEAGFCGDIDSFTYFISNGTISDTATVTIEVLCDEIFVFNGFSPNNDGVNETLEIQGIANFPNNVVSIFNRWGNRVYFIEGYSNDEGWTGTFAGKDLPDGTYFYMIEDGEGGKYTGWLQIRR
ncbi:MAG: gliding motility-associated C-terminal domain-containing protein [Saprospiraceae bacterium]